MTCIVGIEFGGKVILGGDIQGTGGNTKVVHTQPKVFIRGGVAFGYTSSYRFGQIVEHCMDTPVPPAGDEDIYRWLITVLAPSMKDALGRHGYQGGGNCLVGVRGQLWEMQDDFSVIRSKLGYATVGSGMEYALGSIFADQASRPPRTDSEAAQMARNAVQAAGTFSPSVGTEAEVVST
jgi:ATP-dependent protease HslVU (ClpYQ) peptidase subunit